MLVAFGAEVPGQQEVGPRPGHGGHRGQGCAGPIGSGQPGNTGLASPRLTKHSHISLYKYCFFFLQIKVWGSPVRNKSVSTFSQECMLTACLCVTFS